MPHGWLFIVVHMRRIIVIADDITGAAEIAGIATRYGLSVSMVVFNDVIGADLRMNLSLAQCYVIATDTRSMDVEGAVETTKKVVRWVKRKCGDETLPPHTLWYKKTDSALRGHVVEELEALMTETGHRKTLYLPANPSKGRTIQDGIYYVYGVPIDQTDFSFDPEFPAWTANVVERLSFDSSSKIFFANATTVGDIRLAVQQADKNTLLAGAADLFEAFLCKGESTCSPTNNDGRVTGGHVGSPLQDFYLGETGEGLLVVCGSTQSKPDALGLPVVEIPREVYDGEIDVNGWIDDYLETHSFPTSMALSFGNNRHRAGREAALYMRDVMAKAAKRIIAVNHPKELVIEGGSTAFRLLESLGWNMLTITQELSPGIVRMRTNNGMYVTMKPGSYPWKT